VVSIFVSAPLRITSTSLTARSEPQAKMHRVVELQAFEPGWPVPKLRVKTACARFLVGTPFVNGRPQIECKGCSNIRLIQEVVTTVVIPSWKTIFDALPANMMGESTFVMEDWTGQRHVMEGY
jgi:hypothetical protein